jgi:hypothetical protein
MANPIGTVTRTEHIGEAGRSPFIDVVSFPGPAAAKGGYNTGGNTGLLAALQALTGDAREIIAAVQMTAAGYWAEYTVATDKVKVFGTGAANKAAGTELDAATALDGVTFRFLVVSQ